MTKADEIISTTENNDGASWEVMRGDDGNEKPSKTKRQGKGEIFVRHGLHDIWDCMESHSRACPHFFDKGDMKCIVKLA